MLAANQWPTLCRWEWIVYLLFPVRRNLGGLQKAVFLKWSWATLPITHAGVHGTQLRETPWDYSELGREDCDGNGGFTQQFWTIYEFLIGREAFHEWGYILAQPQTLLALELFTASNQSGFDMLLTVELYNVNIPFFQSETRMAGSDLVMFHLTVFEWGKGANGVWGVYTWTC